MKEIFCLQHLSIWIMSGLTINWVLLKNFPIFPKSQQYLLSGLMTYFITTEEKFRFIMIGLDKFLISFFYLKKSINTFFLWSLFSYSLLLPSALFEITTRNLRNHEQNIGSWQRLRFLEDLKCFNNFLVVLFNAHCY